MAEVELPNGDIVEVPDNMPRDQIRKNLLRAFPEQFPDAPESKAADQVFAAPPAPETPFNAMGFVEGMTPPAAPTLPDNAAVMAAAKTGRDPLPRGGGMTPGMDPTRENVGASWFAGRNEYEPLKDASGNYIKEVQRGIPGNSTIDDIKVAGALQLSTDPVKRAAMLQKLYPGSKVRQERGNTVITFPDGTERVINAKGFSGQDVIDALREVGLMAGMGKLIGAGGGLAAQAGRAGAVVGGTEAALGAGAKLAGSGEGWMDVATRAGASGLAAGGGTLAIGGLTNVIGNLFAKRAAGAADDFAKVGIKPTLGQRTGSGTVQEIENFFAKLPGGKASLARETNRNAKIFEKNINSAIRKLGGADDAVVAGDKVLGGFKSYSDRGFKVFAKMTDKIKADPNKVVGTQNVRTFLDEQKTGRFGDLFDDPVVNKIRAKLDQGLKPTWAEMNALRQKVGAKLNSPSQLPDGVDAQNLRNLYGAIKEDLRKSLTPAQQKVWDKANKFMARRFDEMDKARKLVRAGEDEPERLFNSIKSAMRRGPTTVERVMKKLAPAEKDALRASMLDDILNASRRTDTPGTPGFSVNQFLNEWGKINPGAAKAMFGKKYVADMNRLARVAERLKSASMLGANPSGTALGGAEMAAAAAFGGGLATGNIPAIAGAAGTYAAGQSSRLIARMVGNVTPALMRSARFVGWLSAGTKLKSATAIAKHVGRLGMIANELDPDTRDAIQKYLETLNAGD